MDTLYVAGPMRGLPLFNFSVFFLAAMELRARGHRVFNPAERDMAIGLNPALALDSPENMAAFDIGDAFVWDFNSILKSDAIVLLPGWRKSKGVQAELVLALALKRKVFEWIDMHLRPLKISAYTIAFKVEGRD